MQSNKEHLVLVRCSDGRIKVPTEFDNYIVHPISLPGGSIAPELSSVTNNGGEKTLEVLVWFIETMVSIKSPTRIVLVAHSHCAAAGMVGYDDKLLEAACLRFALALSKRFPDVRVTVFFDKHSECGQFREAPRFVETATSDQIELV